MDKIARFQFGVVGVGHGNKAHFVHGSVNEKNVVFNVDVNCGSQKWSGRGGRSGIWGFQAVAEIVEQAYEVPEDADEFQNRIAYHAAQRAARAKNFVEAFDAAVEKYGAGFCAKCMKSGSWYKNYYQEKEQVNG
jgi:hypothetical protein